MTLQADREEEIPESKEKRDENIFFMIFSFSKEKILKCWRESLNSRVVKGGERAAALNECITKQKRGRAAQKKPWNTIEVTQQQHHPSELQVRSRRKLCIIKCKKKKEDEKKKLLASE